MFAIPAIDHSSGRLARLKGGSIVGMDAFGGDPLAAARSFVSDGASWLHVVDLDLAFRGDLSGTETLSALAGLGVPVQASGGIRTEEAAGSLLDQGATRVVLGSSALVDPGLVEGVVASMGERLAIGLEVQDGELRPRGAPVLGALPTLPDALALLERVSVSRIVLTAVGSVGTMGGPDEAAFRAVVDLGIPVILSGGIATLDDVEGLAALDPGPEAVIIGRALYEGGLSFSAVREAIGG